MEVEIKGGAGEFEAAIIAVVLDRISKEEAEASQRRPNNTGGLSAWVRALYPEQPGVPREVVRPD